jgi:hypothetical protein
MMFLFDLIRWYEYERCSLQANSIREATAARKPTIAGTLTATGTIRNVGNTSKRRASTAIGKATTAETRTTEGARGMKQHR